MARTDTRAAMTERDLDIVALVLAYLLHGTQAEERTSWARRATLHARLQIEAIDRQWPTLDEMEGCLPALRAAVDSPSTPAPFAQHLRQIVTDAERCLESNYQSYRRCTAVLALTARMAA